MYEIDVQCWRIADIGCQFPYSDNKKLHRELEKQVNLIDKAEKSKILDRTLEVTVLPSTYEELRNLVK